MASDDAALRKSANSTGRTERRGSLAIKYRHRVLGLLSLLLVITYLDRVCISVAGPRMQEALDIGPLCLGLGDRHLHAVLRGVRNSLRRTRRSHRSAPRTYPHRAVVVRCSRR